LQATIGSLTDHPATFKEAMSRPDKELWEAAINTELAALHAKQVYTEVTLPDYARALPSKLVLDIKRDEHGNVAKYKARLVTKGFRQVAGKDYDEVFAPTAQQVTLKILLAVASAHNLDIDQVDVKTAFLNGDLKDDVYLKLPPELGGNIWQLHKSLYGLKQAARQWHAKLRQEMQANGYTASMHEPCLFYKTDRTGSVYILVHVDDALVIGPRAAVHTAKQLMQTMFEIKDMGTASYFLGMMITRHADGGYSLDQPKYVHDMLHRFQMADCKPVSTPIPVGLKLSRYDGELLPPDHQYQALVGSLIYLAVNTRPDISHAVGILSRFMAFPTTSHWEAAKHVLRYLKGTFALGLRFHGPASTENPGVYAWEMYTDADFAADVDKRKSTTGAVMMMQGAAVSWTSKLQSVVATSTAEAEYIAAATGSKEGLWARKMLGEIYGKVSPLMLRIDNEPAIVLITEHTAGQSGRTKHIDVQFHFVRDRYQHGDLAVKFVSTQEQKADMFTKQLPGPAFRKHRSAVMGI
jgi:hypothetical protein